MYSTAHKDLFGRRCHSFLHNYNCMRNSICFHLLNIGLDWLDAGFSNLTEEHVHSLCLQQKHIVNNRL